LALRQTEEVLEKLRPLYPEVDFQVVVIRTHGDANATAPLAGMGLGIFVKEIEQRLLSGELDLAVHSLKDMPTKLPDGLGIGGLSGGGHPYSRRRQRHGASGWDGPGHLR
jgi:hydroxymethylbilane synthase